MMQTKFFSQISLQLTPLPEHTLLFQIYQCYFPLPRNVIFSHSFIFSQARDTPSLAFGGVGGWTWTSIWVVLTQRGSQHNTKSLRSLSRVQRKGSILLTFFQYEKTFFLCSTNVKVREQDVWTITGRNVTELDVSDACNRMATGPKISRSEFKSLLSLKSCITFSKPLTYKGLTFSHTHPFPGSLRK